MSVSLPLNVIFSGIGLLLAGGLLDKSILGDFKVDNIKATDNINNIELQNLFYVIRYILYAFRINICKEANLPGC